MERVFRLHLAAPNDTICLSRAFVSFESATVLLWSGAVFYLQQRLQGIYPFSMANDKSTADVF